MRIKFVTLKFSNRQSGTALKLISKRNIIYRLRNMHDGIEYSYIIYIHRYYDMSKYTIAL
jgi:hypothetical protein